MAASLDIVVFFIVLSVFVVMFVYRRRSTIPVTNWPFFGMLPDLLLNSHRLHDLATHILAIHGATFMLKGLWFANMDMLVTSDPTNIHHMLSKNFPNYPKGPFFRNIFDILGDGIFNSDHHLWEFHRKTIMSLLKHPDFYSTLELIVKNKVKKGLLPLMDYYVSHDQQHIDLQDIFHRFTFDTTCLLLLDYDPESLSLPLAIIPCEKALTVIQEALLWRHVLPEKVWKLQKRFGWGKEKKLSEASKAFDEFIYKCFSQKEDQLGSSSSSGSSVGIEMGLFRVLRQGYQGQSIKFLKDTILNLMFAGTDTTSTSLSWFFYLLAQNPTVENKIREEIKKQLGGGNWKSLGAKQLGGLLYLHGGLCEALRLYPPVAFEHKTPLEHDVLPSGHKVNEQTKIILSFYSMGRMKEIWGEDCMEFKPERWFSAEGKGIKHQPSYKFTAFHAGPRSCLGKEMALIQMKLVASAVICRYHVKLEGGHEVCPSDSIILHMKYGLKVRLFPILQACSETIN